MDYFELTSAMARLSFQTRRAQDSKAAVPHWKPDHLCDHCFTRRQDGDSLYRFIHRFPAELQLLIIKFAVIETPCMKNIFGRCFDPWSCKEGTHEQTEIFPSLCITTMCSHVSEEAWKIFYRESPIVFDRTPLDYDAELFTILGSHVDDTYDPRAMLMLHYYPILNSRQRVPLHQHPNYEGYLRAYAHRHTIHHLVLKTHSDNCRGHVMDWNWPLNIDWESLPQLETLYLDLRGLARQRNHRISNVTWHMVEGAINRMSVLKLKKLVIAGLWCRGLIRGRRCFPALREAFRGVMAEDGVVDFIDSGDAIRW